MDWSAVILGIVEGITEFLPISSTGHLLIAEHWLGQRSEVFNVVIQAGAILAVTAVYRARILSLAFGLGSKENRDYAAKLLGAFLITAILGLIVKKLGVKLPESMTPIALALIVGGIWMTTVEWFVSAQPKRSDITWTVAIVVGLAQVIAGVFPGTSRSAATIFAAMLVGTTDRAVATEFAFLVGIPTMYAASLFELYGALKHGPAHEDWIALAVAFAVSAVTAFIAVKWLLGYIRSHRFTVFAVYRIILGALLLAFAGA